MPAAKSAEGKARQRGRQGQGSQASPQMLVRRMPRRTWADVQGALSHVGDFEAAVQQFQMTQNTAILTLHIPLEYTSDIVLLSQAAVPTIFFRSYIPPTAPSLSFDVLDGDGDG